MKKQILIIGLTLVLLAVGLSGCFDNQSSEENRFVGTWKIQEGSTASSSLGTAITFFSDGTCSVTSMLLLNGTYEIGDEKLTITYIMDDDSEFSHVFDYSFSNNDNTLTLRDLNSGLETDYTKQ